MRMVFLSSSQISDHFIADVVAADVFAPPRF
jgi:hypothetical protein